jgi:hypothetical protein
MNLFPEIRILREIHLSPGGLIIPFPVFLTVTNNNDCPANVTLQGRASDGPNCVDVRFIYLYIVY